MNNDKNKNKIDSICNKIDIILLNNGWNDKNERIIISIGENSASFKWMHERSASFYKIIYQILTILLIIFNTGLSAETLLPENTSNETINLVRQIITYIVTVISVLISFLKLEKLSSKHISAANSFNKLYHKIQQQMCMYRRDRENAQKYISDMLKKYDSLIINSPDINPIILKNFKNIFKNTDISIPDIADKIQKIELITEEENKSNNNEINKNSKSNNKIKNLDVIVVDDAYQVTKKQERDDKTGDDKTDKTVFTKRSLNICNLDQIHNAFQIGGDITDEDILEMHDIEMQDPNKKLNERIKNYKNKKNKSLYEYNRFLQHSNEND